MSRRAHRENFLRNRSLKYLSDTIAEFRRSHACFNGPHRMIHVHKDGPDTTLVSFNISLAAVPTVCNVEGENLILEMDNTPGSFSTMPLSPPALPLSKNDLLPSLARHYVDLRSHSWTQHCLGKDLNVSSKTSTKPLGNLSIEILDASQFPPAGGLFQKLVDPVFNEASHCLLKNTPLGTVMFEVVSSGEAAQEVSVDPPLDTGQAVGPVLVYTEEMVLETGVVFLLDGY